MRPSGGLEAFMTLRTMVILLCTANVAMMSETANAGTCGTSDAPSPFNMAACNPGGSAAGDICQYLAGATWDCGLARHGASGGATGRMVANFGGTANTYSGWGVDGTGANFCCIQTGANVLHLTMYGTDYNDDMAFYFDDGAGKHVDLGPSGATGISSVTGHMYGRPGADVMEGSYDSTGNLTETLDGEDGNDVMHGNDGDETVNGGGYDDILTGDLGDDILIGDIGNDIICDDDNDTIQGGGHNDTLWLPKTSGGSIDPGAGTDNCGDHGTGFTWTPVAACSTWTTTEPASCPVRH
jgi:hypothetical protein